MAEEEATETVEDGPEGQSADDLAEIKAALKKANKEAEKHRRAAKAKDEELSKVKADSDSSKSEIQKLTEKFEAAEKRQAEAERKALLAEVAQEKGLTSAQAKRLQGTSREEMESDADDLLEAFKPADKSEGAGGKPDAEDEKSEDGDGNGKKPPERPRELRDGATSAAGDEEDPEKAAERILQKTRGGI